MPGPNEQQDIEKLNAELFEQLKQQLKKMANYSGKSGHADWRSPDLSFSNNSSQNSMFKDDDNLAYGISVRGKLKININKPQEFINLANESLNKLNAENSDEKSKENNIKNALGYAVKFINQDAMSHTGYDLPISSFQDSKQRETYLREAFAAAEKKLDKGIAEHSSTTVAAALITANSDNAYITTASTGDSYQFLIQFNYEKKEWAVECINVRHDVHFDDDIQKFGLSNAESERISKEAIDADKAIKTIKNDGRFKDLNITKVLGAYDNFDGFLKPSHTSHVPDFYEAQVDINKNAAFVISCSDGIDSISSQEKLQEIIKSVADLPSVTKYDQGSKKWHRAVSQALVKKLVEQACQSSKNDNITATCYAVQANHSALEIVADGNGAYGQLIAKQVVHDITTSVELSLIEQIKKQITAKETTIVEQQNNIQKQIGQVTLLVDGANELLGGVDLVKESGVISALNRFQNVEDELHKTMKQHQAKLNQPKPYSAKQAALIEAKHDAAYRTLLEIQTEKLNLLKSIQREYKEHREQPNNENSSTIELRKNTIIMGFENLKKVAQESIVKNIIKNEITKKHDNKMVLFGYWALNVLMAITVLPVWARIIAKDDYGAAFYAGRTATREAAYNALESLENINNLSSAIAA